MFDAVDCAAAARRRLSRLTAIATVCSLAAVIGCSPAPAAPSNGSVFTQTDLVVGTGAAAASGNTVDVNYTGWLYDPTALNQQGAQFDASSPGTPFTFTLGANQVIQGWEQGIVGMTVGGVRRLVIPPSLAYGDTRHGIIPPNATLVFQIALVNVQ